MHDDRIRFAAARVARLATVRPDGRPHVVPVVFALVGETIWTAVDRKPKSTTALQRLSNVRAHPLVSLLVDQYDEDWTTLWWVRADGMARVVGPADPGALLGLAALVAKYPQYQRDPPPGPFVQIEVTGWSSWSATPQD